MTTYDTIGRGYTDRRKPDARIERQIHAALGDASSVLNVGAGAGSYEPDDRLVVGVDLSVVMLAQRPPRSGPAVRASASALPFPRDAFDAVMATLTVHHWLDVDAGLAEMCRVAPRRVVLTFDPAVAAEMWLFRDYFPGVTRLEAERGVASVEHVASRLDAARVEVVPVQRDCTDGFGGAYWCRPEAYLDPDVRAAISGLALLDESEIEAGVERLRADLASGAWRERNAELLARDEVDLGYRLIVTE